MFHGTYIYRKIVDNDGQVKEVDPLTPVPSAISEIMGDLLFGEFPIISFNKDSTNELYTQWLKNNPQFKTDLLESATYASPLGTVFQYNFQMNKKHYYKFIKSNKTVWDEDIWGISNLKIFDVLGPDQIRKRTGEVVEKANNKFVFYHIQEHTFNYDESLESPYMDDGRKYKIIDYDIKVDKTTREIKKIYNEKETLTDFDFMPIVKLDNLRQMGIKLGKSDYQGKEQLFAEIDNRIDQINYVLQEHAEPWVAVPQGIADENGKFNRRQGKMYEKTGSGVDNEISIGSWDAQLDSAFRQIETMTFMVFFTSRISAPIAGLEKGGQVESGRALKWRSVNTLTMINRKRKYWEEALEKFFYILTQLNDEWKKADISGFTIKWQDSLPMDDTEVVENVIKKVNNGLLSHLKGIQEANEVNEEKAKSELDQINAERKEKASTESLKFQVGV